MTTKFTCIVALLLTSVTSQAGEMLTLNFSEYGASRDKVYGTATGHQMPSISAEAGETVAMRRESGRDYELQGSSYGWAQTQVQQVPRNATSVAVTPTLEGRRVTLKVEYSRKQGNEVQDYSGSVSGELGAWIPLLEGFGAGSATATSGGKTWSAGSNSRGLSVKVELREESVPQ